jgi:hypothetical protein
MVSLPISLVWIWTAVMVACLLYNIQLPHENHMRIRLLLWISSNRAYLDGWSIIILACCCMCSSFLFATLTMSKQPLGCIQLFVLFYQVEISINLQRIWVRNITSLYEAMDLFYPAKMKEFMFSRTYLNLHISFSNLELPQMSLLT